MRGLISFVLVAVTVVFQLTVVDRIAFPGGSGPNLVLVEVAALALASGPLAGALTGFWGGLALDVAPPGSHFTGEDALVFCLVGYACGLLADTSSGDGGTEGGHTALFEILVTAAGAMCGEAMLALLGPMLSDPRVTWSAITNVLPVAVVYDILLCPFVLYATAAALRPARGARGARGDGSPQKRRVPGGFRVRPPGLALRAGGGSVPRLRLSEAGRRQGSMTGSRAGASRRLAPGREPRLKLGQASSLTGLRDSRGGLGPAFSTGLADSRGFQDSRGGLSGSSRVRFSSMSTGRSLLGGSVFSRSSPSLSTPRSLTSSRSSAFIGSSASLRSSAFGRSSAFRRRGNMMRAPGGRTGSAPRLAHLGRGRGPGRLFGAVRRPARPRSPGQGWLRHTSGRRASLGRGWTGASTGLRSGSRGFKGSRGPARLRMPRPKAKRRWRTGGYR